jgi:hypothetical protein
MPHLRSARTPRSRLAHLEAALDPPGSGDVAAEGARLQEWLANRGLFAAEALEQGLSPPWLRLWTMADMARAEEQLFTICRWGTAVRQGRTDEATELLQRLASLGVSEAEARQGAAEMERWGLLV